MGDTLALRPVLWFYLCLLVCFLMTLEDDYLLCELPGWLCMDYDFKVLWVALECLHGRGRCLQAEACEEFQPGDALFTLRIHSPSVNLETGCEGTEPSHPSRCGAGRFGLHVFFFILFFSIKLDILGNKDEMLLDITIAMLSGLMEP